MTGFQSSSIGVGCFTTVWCAENVIDIEVEVHVYPQPFVCGSFELMVHARLDNAWQAPPPGRFLLIRQWKALSFCEKLYDSVGTRGSGGLVCVYHFVCDEFILEL